MPVDTQQWPDRESPEVPVLGCGGRRAPCAADAAVCQGDEMTPPTVPKRVSPHGLRTI